MDVVAKIIIAAGAIILLSVGGYQIFLDHAVSGSTALGFGFLLVILLIVSKFKRIKGFGFEAETWDEKQVEAAKLVDQLKLMSASMAQQSALVGAKLGMMDSGLTLPEKATLLLQLREMLAISQMGEQKSQDIIDPLVQRIKLDFCWAAQRIVQLAIDERRSVCGQQLQGAEPEVRDAQAAEITIIDQSKQKFGQIRPSYQNSDQNFIRSIMSFVSSCPLPADTNHRLMEQLHEICDDLTFFSANRSFRRTPIDYTHLWH